MPPALLPLKALRVAEEMPQKRVRDGAKWMVYDGITLDTARRGGETLSAGEQVPCCVFGGPGFALFWRAYRKHLGSIQNVF